MTTVPPKKATKRPTDRLASAVSLANIKPAVSAQEAGELLSRRRLNAGIRSDALRTRAIALLESGRIADAVADIDASLKIARDIGDTHRQARSLINRGIILARGANVGDALEAYAEALKLSPPMAPIAAVVCMNIGLLAERIDETELTLDFARLAYDLLPEGTHRSVVSLNIGVAMGRQDRWQEGKPFLQSAVDSLNADSEHGYRLAARQALAVANAYLGQTSASLQALRRVLEEARSNGLERASMSCERVLAETLALDGQPVLATQMGERWLTAYPDEDDLQRRDVERWLANAWASVGNSARALELLQSWAAWRQQLSTDPAITSTRKKLFRLLESATDLLRGARSKDATYEDDPVVARRLKLSRVESEILWRIAKGETNPVIAAAMGSTLPAVRNRISRVLIKLGAENRAAAARRAIELGVIRRVDFG